MKQIKMKKNTKAYSKVELLNVKSDSLAAVELFRKSSLVLRTASFEVGVGSLSFSTKA